MVLLRIIHSGFIFDSLVAFWEAMHSVHNARYSLTADSGTPYHDSSIQGGVECGNAPFKEALQKWMQANGKDWTVGMFMVNAAINQRTLRVKGEYSPYSIY